MRNIQFNGRCNIAASSGLRKRMRAARRFGYPVIAATEKMLMRHGWYRRKKMLDKLRELGA